MNDKKKALENISGVRDCLELILEFGAFDEILITSALDLLYEAECEVKRLME